MQSFVLKDLMAHFVTFWQGAPGSALVLFNVTFLFRSKHQNRRTGWLAMAKQILSFLVQCQYDQGHTCCKITVLLIIYQFTPFLLKDHILRLQWHQIVEVFFVLFFVLKFQIKILCDC